MTTVVLQGNLGRGRTAQDLLVQMACERAADVVVISEQYQCSRDRRPQGWYSDETDTAAIWVRTRANFPVTNSGRGRGYVWLANGSVTLVSCYLSPNEGIAIFRQKLEEIEDVAREFGGEVVLAGDFNAKSVEWGMPSSDTRGNAVAEMAARLDMTVLNTGVSTTFRRRGCAGTIIDITLATPGMAAAIKEWQVLEDFTHSDHQYIGFVIQGTPGSGSAGRGQKKVIGWNVAKLDRDAFLGAVAKGQGLLAESTSNATTAEEAESLVDRTMRLITKACNASMPKKLEGGGRRSAYWWNDEIAELRRGCLKLRRTALKLRRRNEGALEHEQYLAAKKRLTKAIKARKASCWRELCEEVNDDLFGKGFQLVTRKFGRLAPEGAKDPETMEEIVANLFPEHPKRERAVFPTPTEIPPFTVEELRSAAGTLSNRKAPGPDGIPNEVLKIVAKEHPFLLLNMYNACLRAGVFSPRWKRQRLVLLDKGKGLPVTPSSYRPLCMLDTAGKVLERLLRGRLRAAIAVAGGLAEAQHGFRPGRSTVGAVKEVLREADRAWQGNHRTRSVCVVVTLDVKNAFNSVRWTDILEALRRHFHTPEYLVRVIEDYLWDRVLLYETTDGPKSVEVTAGVAQGSAFGPDLWNAVYNGILTLSLPVGTSLIGFADDIAALVLAREEEEAKRKVARVTLMASDWLEEHGLQLEAKKTEMVVLTRQRKFSVPFRARIVGHDVVAVPTIRYLGFQLDAKLTFWAHISQAAEKAATLVAMLSRLMPNIAGPRSSKRRILLCIAHSIMLYGAEIWADALKMEKYRKRLASVQRRAALRVASAYRSVSEAAVLAVAGVIPIDLLASERKRAYDRRGEADRSIVRSEEHRRTLQQWEERWRQQGGGSWTYRLIGGVVPWTDRKHGEVNFYLTQLLTGHGHFNRYLYRRSRKPSPFCDYCPQMEDDARHTFFECDRWSVERRLLCATLNANVTPDNIVAFMLASQDGWDAVCLYAETVLRQKKLEERDRDATPAS